MPRSEKKRKPTRREEPDEMPKKRKRPAEQSRPKHLKQWLMEVDEENGFQDVLKSKNG